MKELTTNELLALAHVDFDLNGQALARLSDEWEVVKKGRLEADKIAAKLKERESQIEALIVEQLRRQNMTAVGGQTVITKLSSHDVPAVEDWPAFYEYIWNHKDFSLLERRPGRAAIKERWEDGKQVPGVSKFPVFKLTRERVKG